MVLFTLSQLLTMLARLSEVAGSFSCSQIWSWCPFYLRPKTLDQESLMYAVGNVFSLLMLTRLPMFSGQHAAKPQLLCRFKCSVQEKRTKSFCTTAKWCKTRLLHLRTIFSATGEGNALCATVSDPHRPHKLLPSRFARILMVFALSAARPLMYSDRARSMAQILHR
jgi:hypothetical protein